MKSWKQKLATLCIVGLLVFAVGWVGILDKNDQDMEGKWTFWKDVQVKQAVDIDTTLTVDGASTLTGNVSAAGDLSVTGSGTFGNEVVMKATAFTAGGSWTWTTAMGNVMLTSGATTSSIALPKGTAAMSGYVLWVKNVSGATIRLLTPNAVTPPADTIESTQGTNTGTSDNNIDAAGDIRAWVYQDYGTATSGVWYLLLDER